MFKQSLFSLIVLSCYFISGCTTPLSLNKAVIRYDKSTNLLISDQLLLNIGRADQHIPSHFTGVSNIAATYNWQVNGGIGPAATGDKGSLLTPAFGGSYSDNPTISIIPIEGDEFTRRMLTPLPESRLTMLLRQGMDIDMALRLLASEIRVTEGPEEGVYKNQPANKVGYTYFRQAVLQLSAIQDNNHLFAEPVLYTRSWTLPLASMSAADFSSLQKEYDLDIDYVRGTVTLQKIMEGPIILTNYDITKLNPQEREKLIAAIPKGAQNDVMVDIRSGYPGGDWPIRGFFRLRSFNNVLHFIGETIHDHPEYPVPPNPRTPPVKENPTWTLKILAQPKSSVTHDNFHIDVGDTAYSLAPDVPPSHWNKNSFKLLTQIYQMTMTNVANTQAPALTIAK